jgi:hypothetical protein
MEMAQLLEIEETNLYALIRALPSLWDFNNPEPGIKLNALVEKIGEAETLLFGAFVYTVGSFQATILMEYYRDERKAVFEVHSFGFTHAAKIVTNEFAEKRLREIISESQSEIFSAFLAFPPGAKVQCQKCDAKYTFSATMVSQDGSILCPNCGQEIEYSEGTEN